MKWQILIILLPILFISACSTAVLEDSEKENAISVVKTYFESWNHEDYTSMYEQMSDGFKKIEPTANTLSNFTAYAKSQNVESVTVETLEVKKITRTKATIDYSVIFMINNNQIPFSGTFTLKYKPEDSIPGWKMIHPYGDNIDFS